MPQGRMTDDEAYALGRKQRLANEARLRGAGGAGGFKGVAKPGEAVQAMMNGKKVFISGSAITDDSGPSMPAPQKPDRASMHFNKGESREDFLKRVNSVAPAAPERKVNMQSGMGNTDTKKVFAEKPSVTQGMLASNPLDYIKKTPGAMRDALGFGTDMLRRGLEKGNTGMVKQDYLDRLKGSDVYRKLDSASQGHVMKAYQQWLNSQSTFNEGKRKTMAVEKDFKRTFGQASDGIS